MVWNRHFAGLTKNSFDSQLLECIREKSNKQIEFILQDAKHLCTAVDSSGASLLHYATECGNETITQLLLKSGAKVDLQDEKGRTPLALATKGNYENTIRVLLEHNADIYVTDINGVSALQLAVQQSLRFPKILTMFLTEVAKVSSASEVSRTFSKIDCPLYIAVCLQNVDVVSYMLSAGSSIDKTESEFQQTALHVAVQYRNAKMVELLVDRGANVNALDAKNETPLSLIRTFDELEILKILVDNGTNLTSCTEDGFMQMYWVLTKGTRKAVKVVLESGIDLQARDLHGQNAIHYLAKNVNKGITDTLHMWIWKTDDGKSDGPQKVASDSVDSNARDRKGRTALHIAMAAGNATFIKFLLSKGANTNVKTINGVTPFFEALESKSESTLERRVKCVKLIMENGAYPDIEIERYLEIYKTESAINRHFSLLEPVLAHLVLREAKGERISEKILESVVSHPKLKDYAVSCREELYRMKNMRICRSFGKPVTLFDFITDTDSRFVFYAEHIFDLELLMKNYKFDSYYACILRKRVAETSKISDNPVILLRNLVLVSILFFVVYALLVAIEHAVDRQNYVEILMKAFTSTGFFTLLAIYGFFIGIFVIITLRRFHRLSRKTSLRHLDV